jgi:hypothetical protein
MQSLQLAEDTYQRQVRKGWLRDRWRRITGKPTHLAKFDNVARQVNARQRLARRLQEVPLARIVGSVGRTQDFTREFLPRPCVNPERWARIDAAVKAGISLPPVELLQIGEVYFVDDGNHRTSVARANGFETLEAYVTEMASAVHLTVADFRQNRSQNKTGQAADPSGEAEHRTKKGGASMLDDRLTKLIVEERRHEAEQQRLYRQARTNQPRFKDRLLLYLGDIFVVFGNRLKANAMTGSHAAPLH